MQDVDFTEDELRDFSKIAVSPYDQLHYAQLDENNVVINVICVNPDEPDFVEKLEGRWVQTDYATFEGIHYEEHPTYGRVPSLDQSKAFRKNFACIDGYYDEERDAFVLPKPFESWVFNEPRCIWEPPIPMPRKRPNTLWRWDETSLQWLPDN